jgi:serine/threonine protein phosphatase PrpC
LGYDEDNVRVNVTLPEYAINSYGVSDIGCVRSVNEDVFAIVDERQFFVLADGMGGHAAGEIAASLAVDFLVAAVKETSSFDSCVHAYGFLQKSLLKANQHVWQKAAQNPAWHGMGSTLCCCLFHNNFILYGHVGDSRLYRIRSDDIIIHQLTQDHSPPLVGGGRGKSHLLTRAFGRQKQVSPDFGILSVSSGDLFILCSDGVTDLISDEEISMIVTSARQSNAIHSICYKLLRTAVGRGGHDNATVLVTQVQETYKGLY